MVDDAYAEYMKNKDYKSGLDLFKNKDNVFVLRTFSKIFGLASLRVGWGYGSKKIINALNVIKPPFNVSHLAQLAATESLKDNNFIKQSIKHNLYFANKIKIELEKYNIFSIGFAAETSELKSNIEKALDEIRPFLQNDGGDISLISIEDEKIVKPTIKYLKNGYNVSGPYPADTIFLKNNRKKFDVIIGMYHDQVLAPLKTLFEYDAINITLGLPFIRVSPDHGPNETMLGKNQTKQPILKMRNYF